MKRLLPLLLSIPLFATVENSVIPMMNTPPHFAEEQINIEQTYEMSCGFGTPIRVMSFNMLVDRHDDKLEPENRWPVRRERLVEYLKYAEADIIGSQELVFHQTNYLLEQLGAPYDAVGKEPIFFNHDRVTLLRHWDCDIFTIAKFKDNCSGALFTVINGHLSFSKVNKRLLQAHHLQQLIQEQETPVIAMGDMNTFPMRPELAIPFYDGDHIVRVIEEGGVRDARTAAIKGQFGLISTTSYNTDEMHDFGGYGTPGIFLDHIFVSPQIRVNTHAIDPALVDGGYTSDHFPLLADLVICSR
ncbi:MAG: endonuclease/exonuclease/phosphatase family protein [Chlamydiales bacterium]|nr:endonuclease/exonuclease/phosphatase family protein [Chlamydiales bacterium]